MQVSKLKHKLNSNKKKKQKERRQKGRKGEQKKKRWEKNTGRACVLSFIECLGNPWTSDNVTRLPTLQPLPRSIQQPICLLEELVSPAVTLWTGKASVWYVTQVTLQIIKERIDHSIYGAGTFLIIQMESSKIKLPKKKPRRIRDLVCKAKF